MNSWFKSTVSVFLGVMILLVGSGVSLAKMVCVKSGYTSFMINTPDDCCKHKHPQAPYTLEEKCCDISSLHVEMLHYLNSATQNIEKSADFVELPRLDFGVTAYQEVISNQFREFSVPPDISIPPLRIFTKSFQI